MKGRLKIGRATSIAVLPLAVSVHAYTGFIFGVVAARGYWHTALMPLYFLMGAIISGFSVLLMFCIMLHYYQRWRGTQITVDNNLIQISRKYLASVIAIYPLFVVSHLIMMLYGPEEGYIAAMVALHEPLFLLGDLLMGVVIPLFILYNPRTQKSIPWMFLAAFMALTGVFFARYSVCHIGQVVPLS
jgi:formate-dependent nitrite reductase membrane component NrfD